MTGTHGRSSCLGRRSSLFFEALTSSKVGTDYADPDGMLSSLAALDFKENLVLCDKQMGTTVCTAKKLTNSPSFISAQVARPSSKDWQPQSCVPIAFEITSEHLALEPPQKLISVQPAPALVFETIEEARHSQLRKSASGSGNIM